MGSAGEHGKAGAADPVTPLAVGLAAALRSDGFPDVDGRRALVCSLGREGKDLASWLVGHGAVVTMCDSRTDAQLAAASAEAPPGVGRVMTGRPFPDPHGFDLIGVSQSVLASDAVVSRARALGIPVISPMQLFLRLCPSPIIGITGSNGKSTTTALVGEMARQQGVPHVVAGNIGAPVLGLLGRLRPEITVILEISHTQLQYTDRSPALAAVTNVSANHLDQFDWDAYVALKQNLLRWQGTDAMAVMNADDPTSCELTRTARGRVMRCSLDAKVDGPGAWVEDETVVVRADGQAEHVMASSEIALRGRHNLANAVMATAIASAAGWSLDSARVALRQFRGLAHRLEIIGSAHGVIWIDDSIATTPERVLAGLASIESPVVLLLGGRDKGLSLAGLREAVTKRCRAVICFGEAGSSFAAALSPAVADLHQVSTLDQAVSLAATTGQAGDVVLLSPAGTSFDAYANFESRGDAFRGAVQALPDFQEA